MADDSHWSWEAWAAAIAALPSMNKLLAFYEGGAVSCCEVLDAVWSYCQDKPEVAAQLVRTFQDHPDEYIRGIVGKGLQELLRQKNSDLA